MGCGESELSLRPSGIAYNKHSGVHSEKKLGNNHPTVKPIKLMEYLIKLVTIEKAIVLDPFAGSGSTLVACRNLGRQFIGIELSQEYVEIANKRIADFKQQLVLVC